MNPFASHFVPRARPPQARLLRAAAVLLPLLLAQPAFALSPGDILVVDADAGTSGQGALFRVDPDTGARTVLSDFGVSSPLEPAPSATYADQVLSTPGLVGYWRFEPSTQADSSLNGYTGNFVGGAAVSGSGEGPPLAGVSDNHAVMLNGTSAYVSTSLGSDSSSQFPTAATIIAWVFLNQQPSTDKHFFQIAAKAKAGDDLDFQIETNNATKFYTDSGSATVYNTPLPLQTWVNLAAEFDTGSRFRRIFLNGVRVADTTPYTGGHSANTNLFSIGANLVFPGRFFDGSLDEVAIFNRALSDAEIQAIYQSAGMPSLTPSTTPTPTSTATSTATFTPTQTATATATPTSTATLTATPTRTPTSTSTATSTATPTYTTTPTSTPTRTSTSAPTITPTLTATRTPTTAPTSTGAMTPTATPTSSATGAATRTHTPTSAPTAAPADTRTPTHTPALTRTPSRTPTYTPMHTLTVTPTTTPTRTATTAPAITGSATPTATPSRATATLTQTPTGTPSATTPTVTTTTTGTRTPTRTPTATPLPPSPTPTATATRTPELITVNGLVRKPGAHGEPGPHGLIPAVGVTVDAFICQNRHTCLDMPGDPVGSAVTDDSGRFAIVIDADALVGNLLLLQASVDGVKIRALVTPHQLHIVRGGPLSLRAVTADEPEVLLDPISEAAVLVLDIGGVANYSDDSIEAVSAAVEAANADSTFDGLTTEEAATHATETAASNDEVQRLLQETQFTPTPTPTATPVPCAGDCNRDGEVTIDELTLMVNIALEQAAIGDCRAGDAGQDGQITIDEIILAVNNALNVCVAG